MQVVIELSNPHDFAALFPAIHSSQCENFETRLGERLLPSRRAASQPKDTWTKVIEGYSVHRA